MEGLFDATYNEAANRSEMDKQLKELSAAMRQVGQQIELVVERSQLMQGVIRALGPEQEAEENVQAWMMQLGQKQVELDAKLELIGSDQLQMVKKLSEVGDELPRL